MSAKGGKKESVLFLGCEKRLYIHPVHGATPAQHPATRGGCEAALRLSRTRINCGFTGKIIKRRWRKENLDGQQRISEAGKLKKKKKTF